MADQTAIELIKKYNPTSLNDIANLPISDAEKALMHSQFKLDSLFLSKLMEDKINKTNFFNMEELVGQYGQPSYSPEEISKLIDIDLMNKSLGGGAK